MSHPGPKMEDPEPKMSSSTHKSCNPEPKMSGSAPKMSDQEPSSSTHKMYDPESKTSDQGPKMSDLEDETSNPDSDDSSEIEEDKFLHSNDVWKFTHGEIIFSAVVFRHGDRYPFGNLPGSSSTGKQLTSAERGNLTKKGKARAYRLGLWLRVRYNHLIKDQPYSSSLLNMISSRTERTIMSGQLVLAGFCPPIHEEEIWNKDILWQPIPVYPLPAFDRIFGSQDYCPRYNIEMERIKNDPEILEFYEIHKNRLDYLRECSKHSLHGTHEGIDPILESIMIGAHVYDTLDTQDELGWELPDWADKIYYPVPRVEIKSMALKLRTFTHEMKRLKGGPLLSHIVDELKNKRDDAESKKRFQFYSAHDTTLVTLLNMLGIWKGDLPEYCSTLLFELRKLNDEYIVTVAYKGFEGGRLELMEIPNSPELCTLDDFIKVTEPLIPEDWDTECKVFVPDYNRIF